MTNADVDIVGTFWVSEDGHRAVDLEGLQPGCLAQTFTTVPGTTYNLSFWMAGNPVCGAQLKQASVSAAGQSRSFSFSVAGHSQATMGWVQKTWSFVANLPTTTLEFCDLATTGSCGAAIDNVVVDGLTPVEGTSWGRLKTVYR